MRFVVTGEWSRNRLLQTIVVLYTVYVGGLWVTNALLYFHKMSLWPSSVVEYYLGNEEKFLQPRSYQGLPPFELMLGRASAIELEYNGAPVDLQPHIRGNVARVTLGEAEQETP